MLSNILLSLSLNKIRELDDNDGPVFDRVGRRRGPGARPIEKRIHPRLLQDPRDHLLDEHRRKLELLVRIGEVASVVHPTGGKAGMLVISVDSRARAVTTL